MLGWNPFWVFLDFQAQPRTITLGWALESRKTLKGVQSLIRKPQFPQHTSTNTKSTQSKESSSNGPRRTHLLPLNLYTVLCYTWNENQFSTRTKLLIFENERQEVRKKNLTHPPVGSLHSAPRLVHPARRWPRQSGCYPLIRDTSSGHQHTTAMTWLLPSSSSLSSPLSLSLSLSLSHTHTHHQPR